MAPPLTADIRKASTRGKRLLGVGALLLVAAATACAADPGPATNSPPLRLVTIGDSIPDTLEKECPGCTGFVHLYAQALSEATGQEVESANHSDHTSKTLPVLLDELAGHEGSLREADAIIVGIAHNSILLNAAAPCGTRWDDQSGTFEDWSQITPECSQEWAERYRPKYDRLFSTIAGWREGKPTALLTINKYSDWIGWKDAHLSEDQERRTVFVHDDWNTMLCAAAERHGFSCADIYHVFNGPDGTRPSGDLLGGDYTHPSQQGNDRIADALIDAGFGPLA